MNSDSEVCIRYNSDLLEWNRRMRWGNIFALIHAFLSGDISHLLIRPNDEVRAWLFETLGYEPKIGRRQIWLSKRLPPINYAVFRFRTPSDALSFNLRWT